MTEFETKLIAQLEILNENLSTKNVYSTLNLKTNFAESLLSSIKAIENRIQILNNAIGLLTQTISKK